MELSTISPESVSNRNTPSVVMTLAGPPLGRPTCLRQADPVKLALLVTRGKAVGPLLLSPMGFVEQRCAAPLHITGLAPSADGKSVDIALANASPETRVHVVATRYLPAHSPADHIGSPSLPGLAMGSFRRERSVYLSGRNIGDEYRYILDRKYARKYPGNMLK